MADPNEALRRRILARPDDDAPRRELAARWRAAGDARGEFVDVQLALAALPRWHPDRPALAARERDLLAAHRDAWLRALPIGGLAPRFRRGFVEHVEGTPAEVRDDLPALAAQEPVTSLELSVDEESAEDPALRELSSCAALAGMRELSLADAEARPERFATLLASSAFVALQRLTLGEAMCSAEVLAALAAVDVPETLRAVHLDGHMGGCGDAGVLELVRAPWLPRLDDLRLHGQSLTDTSLAALAESELAPQHLGLVSAGYGDHAFTAGSLRGAAKAAMFSSLRSLSLIGAPVGEALPDVFEHARGLRSAWLARTGLDGDDLRLLLRPLSFEGWQELSLSGNPIGDLGARMLAMCHRLPRVLVLSSCGITPAGLRELATAPPVDALDLRGNPLPADAWRQQLEGDALPRATSLLVDASDWPDELVRSVRAHYPRADLIGVAT